MSELHTQIRATLASVSLLQSSLVENHGVVSRSVLLAAGLTPYEIGRARHVGMLWRVRRAWYAEPGADPKLVGAVRVGGALTCVTALERAGVWIRPDTAIHVAVPANAARLRSISHTRVPLRDEPSGVRLHWRREGGVIAHPITNIVESLAHCAVCQPPELALVAIDCALNRGLATLSDLRPTLTTVSSQRLLDRADASSQSGLETLARYRLRRLRVLLRTQVFIDGVGRVDVLIGDRLVLELDGYGFHATGEFFESDRRRDLALLARGYRVLRLSYRQVMFEWAEAERVILTLIRRGDHMWPRIRS